MEYREYLTVDINRKGVIDLDTVKGCYYGMRENPKGCYGLCYARKLANAYGFDFSNSISREVRSKSQIRDIVKRVARSKVPFIRIGTKGDPCHDWILTLKMCRVLRDVKPIVIITKHWIRLNDEQIEELGKWGVIINTSISALDRDELRIYRLKQYERYKMYGVSVLRIVSCKFNLENEEGKRLNDIQERLFEKVNIIDNPLRLNEGYPLLKEGVILAERMKDLNGDSLISKFREETYIGICKDCPEQCGLIWRKG